jgi:hypothetical protein
MGFENAQESDSPESHFEHIRRTIAVYEAALKGEVEVHYWSSPIAEIMETRFTMPGEQLERTPPSMTPEFAQATGTEYLGTMPASLLQKRIDEMRAGNGV